MRITPNGLGLRSYQLTLASNDPDQPTVAITITANSVTLPPCDLSITRSVLNFGVVGASRKKLFVHHPESTDGSE